MDLITFDRVAFANQYQSQHGTSVDETVLDAMALVSELMVCAYESGKRGESMDTSFLRPAFQRKTEVIT